MENLFSINGRVVVITGGTGNHHHRRRIQRICHVMIFLLPLQVEIALNLLGFVP